MLTAINLGIAAPGFFYIAALLLQDVSGVKPALEVPAAELSLGVLLVAGALSRLLEFDLVMRKLRSSERRSCGQSVYLVGGR